MHLINFTVNPSHSDLFLMARDFYHFLALKICYFVTLKTLEADAASHNLLGLILTLWCMYQMLTFSNVKCLCATKLCRHWIFSYYRSYGFVHKPQMCYEMILFAGTNATFLAICVATAFLWQWILRSIILVSDVFSTNPLNNFMLYQ